MARFSGDWDAGDLAQSMAENAAYIAGLTPADRARDAAAVANALAQTLPGATPFGTGYGAAQGTVVPVGSPVATVTSRVGPEMASPVFAMADTQDSGDVARFIKRIVDEYGSIEPGQVRFSSVTLENGPSGVRIGTLSRIVIADTMEGM